MIGSHGTPPAASMLYTKPVAERLQRLLKARDVLIKVLNGTSSGWENGCENGFSEFRVSCVHMRKEKEALDSVEGKDDVWRFIFKFSKTRPFMHDRCIEVLRILMISDLWMQAAAANPDLDIDDLPPEIADEFRKRAEEVRQGEPPPEEVPVKQSTNPWDPAPKREAKGYPAQQPHEPPPPGYSETLTRPQGMHVVVQRCVKARVLVDAQNDWWEDVGPGLVLYVSFAKDATEERVVRAARFLLSSKLSAAYQPSAPGRRGGFSKDAASVVDLCKKGQEQGIVVLHQGSLASGVAKDLHLTYDHQVRVAIGAQLYKRFLAALQTAAIELVLGVSVPQRGTNGVHGSFYDYVNDEIYDRRSHGQRL
eukprot:TRINITY_DN51183_c0_g1_i2.p1 TRINITY_DN51183_c0_g1~~TRINITY_DN51183_c0_g1_i2.p1  ORF type:complete len:365 (-),score=86.84 TRINITY_DN51183_c0_g1_i2:146-1240(-)